MINFNRFPVTCVYYKGEWVYLPLFFVPEEAITDDRLFYFQLTPVDGKKISDPEPEPRRNWEVTRACIRSKAKSTILPWMISNKELKELCARYNIPIGWVINIPKSKVSKAKYRKQTGRKKRKCSFLDRLEYKSFIEELGKLSATAEVIAEILWFLNQKLSKGNDYVTLEEILRLTILEIDVEDVFSGCISLSRSSQKSSHIVGHYLKEKLWVALNKQIRQDSGFVFSNKNGGPLLPGDIDRVFKKAGKNAGIKGSVTSLSLRPHSSSSRIAREVSVLEWDMLCQKIPKLKSRSGRPSKHDPRVILNAIFLHIDTKTPIRKLPKEYPPGKSVYSQYIRWKENGIFKAILRFLP